MHIARGYALKFLEKVLLIFLFNTNSIVFNGDVKIAIFPAGCDNNIRLN